MEEEYQVTIPEWIDYYIKARNTRPKFWLWKDREKLPKKYMETLRESPVIIGGKAFCCDNQESRFIKNTKKVGTANLWRLNGQDLYSGVLHHTLRKSIAQFFHNYFSGFISDQLKPIQLNQGEFLSISCDIYEIKRTHMPDVSNMWLLEKFFEDSLQECGIIPGDDPDIVIESGRKRYYWVSDQKERKLIFKIKKIQCQEQ